MNNNKQHHIPSGIPNDNNGTFTMDSGGNFAEASWNEILKLWKGHFGNSARFKEKMENRLNWPDTREFYNFIVENIDEAPEFSYKEVFQIENDHFQALAFSVVDVQEMMQNLNAKRHTVEGVKVERQTYDTEGNPKEVVEYDNVYEVHYVDGTPLDVNDWVYALRCWCTSTNEEHWIWIEDQYKDDPIAAIASTCMVPKNHLEGGYIQALKRQGDIFITEYGEEAPPEPDEWVALTREQYLNLLISET